MGSSSSLGGFFPHLEEFEAPFCLLQLSTGSSVEIGSQSYKKAFGELSPLVFVLSSLRGAAILFLLRSSLVYLYGRRRGAVTALPAMGIGARGCRCPGRPAPSHRCGEMLPGCPKPRPPSDTGRGCLSALYRLTRCTLQ